MVMHNFKETNMDTKVLFRIRKVGSMKSAIKSIQKIIEENIVDTQMVFGKFIIYTNELFPNIPEMDDDGFQLFEQVNHDEIISKIESLIDIYEDLEGEFVKRDLDCHFINQIDHLKDKGYRIPGISDITYYIDEFKHPDKEKILIPFSAECSRGYWERGIGPVSSVAGVKSGSAPEFLHYPREQLRDALYSMVSLVDVSPDGTYKIGFYKLRDSILNDVDINDMDDYFVFWSVEA